MKLKGLIILLIILIVVTAAGVSVYFKFFAQITIRDEQITYDMAPLKVTITYPQIAGLFDFNQKAKTIIDKELNDFRTNSLANDEAVKQIDPESYARYPRTYELDIGYDKGKIDNNIVSIMFSVYNFEGGAHGASYFVPLNYDVKNRKEIALADLFGVPSGSQPDYLQKISDFCVADLTKQIIEKLGSTEGTWIQDGAGPDANNFQFFLINPNYTITFYFPQYQVAPGAAGDFKVTMPR